MSITIKTSPPEPCATCGELIKFDASGFAIGEIAEVVRARLTPEGRRVEEHVLVHVGCMAEGEEIA